MHGVCAEGAYVSVTSSQSILHELGDFSHRAGGRIGYLWAIDCVCFCRVKIGRWETQTLASRNLVRSAAVTGQLRTADASCQCDERWVGEVQRRANGFGVSGEDANK